MNVNEAMTKTVKSCSASSSLDEVARLMWDGDCGAIPVVSDDNRPIGIITDRDIAMCAMHRHEPLWNIQASQVIEGQRLVCVKENDSIEHCVEKMREARVRRIVVTDDHGVLCGIVSLGDTVAFTDRDTDNDDIPAVESERLIGMLRKVSAHHGADGAGDQSLMQLQVSQGY
jgi:CBS domain-containing protein